MTLLSEIQINFSTNLHFPVFRTCLGIGPLLVVVVVVVVDGCQERKAMQAGHHRGDDEESLYLR